MIFYSCKWNDHRQNDFLTMGAAKFSGFSYYLKQKMCHTFFRGNGNFSRFQFISNQSVTFSNFFEAKTFYSSISKSLFFSKKPRPLQLSQSFDSKLFLQLFQSRTKYNEKHSHKDEILHAMVPSRKKPTF
jgi:hypothetical protein